MRHCFLFSFSLLLLCSCEYNNAEEINPSVLDPNQCDTTNVSFSADVYPIITTNCFPCHDGPSAPNGRNLNGYDNVKQVAQTSFTAGDGGLLFNVVNRTSGFAQMPKNQAKLPECSINKIKAWVDAGCPNN